MIYTVTLNPALDRTVVLPELNKDDANRIKKEFRFAGGKGIDVSRVLKELGAVSIAKGFIGGYTGLEIEGRLLNEGVVCSFTKISEETRTNIIIVEENNEHQTTINAKGPEITPMELGLFYNNLKDLEPKPSFAVISGSIPNGINSNFYFQLINLFKEQNTFVVLDADGDAMKSGIKAQPNMIKPNKHEIERLIKRKITSEKELVNESRNLLKRYNIEIIMISAGEEGLYLINKENVLKAEVPKVEVNSAVGAGDSSVAGFLFKFQKNKDLTECLRSAAAAGTACVLTPGTELVKLIDYERIYKQIKIKELKL